MDLPWAQLIVNGLALGSLYTLTALGIVLIYKTTDIITFAQGETAMFCTFVAYALLTALRLPFAVVFVLTLLFATLFGMLIERLILRRVSTTTVVNPVIVTIGLNGVAGAQLAALTEGLARTVGVRSGLLVTYAAVGSPAYTSGLRDGDVIVRVGGDPVRTVAELREQVQRAVENGENSVKLDCVRDRKERTVVLRWNDDR